LRIISTKNDEQRMHMQVLNLKITLGREGSTVTFV